MPMAVIAHMRTRKTTPTVVTQKSEFARWCRPKSRKKYVPVICARLAMTMMSAATMTQPVTHPVLGPMALVTQLKVVPQSGSALFR